MERLAELTTATAIASGASALALPPTSYALVPESWSAGGRHVPEFALEMWADGSRALTAATLYGGIRHPLVQADIAIDSIDHTADEFTETTHGLLTGDGPFPISVAGTIKASLDLDGPSTNINTVIEATTGGDAGNALTFRTVADGAGVGSITRSGGAFTFHYATGVTTVANMESAITALAGADDLIGVKTPGTGGNVLAAPGDTFAATPLAGGFDAAFPAGLSALGAGGEGYFIIKTGANTFKFAETLEEALAGTAFAFTSNGVGVVTLSDSADTTRVHWHNMGLLGPLADGAITLAAQTSYFARRSHYPRVITYALAATFGAGAGLVSAVMVPIADAG